MAERKKMEIIILKIIACICVTVVSGIFAYQGAYDWAFFLELLALAIIFLPWDKIIEFFL